MQNLFHGNRFSASLRDNISQSNFFAAGCKIMQHYMTNLYNIMQHYVIRGDISPYFRRYRRERPFLRR